MNPSSEGFTQLGGVDDQSAEVEGQGQDSGALMVTKKVEESFRLGDLKDAMERQKICQELVQLVRRIAIIIGQREQFKPDKDQPSKRECYEVVAKAHILIRSIQTFKELTQVLQGRVEVGDGEVVEITGDIRRQVYLTLQVCDAMVRSLTDFQHDPGMYNRVYALGYKLLKRLLVDSRRHIRTQMSEGVIAALLGVSFFESLGKYDAAQPLLRTSEYQKGHSRLRFSLQVPDRFAKVFAEMSPAELQLAVAIVINNAGQKLGTRQMEELRGMQLKEDISALGLFALVTLPKGE